jgi:hypothetical protein
MKAKPLPDIKKLLMDGRVVDRVIREGVREALLRHKRAGVPIVVWRSGRIVEVPASKIKVYGGRSRRAATATAPKPRRKFR